MSDLDDKALAIAEAIEDMIIDIIDNKNESLYVNRHTLDRNRDYLIDAIKGLWE